MDTKQAWVNKVRQLIPEARLIYLFGSQADGSFTDASDIDIAVLPKRKIDSIKRFDHEQVLAIEFNQDVDLIDLLSASTVLQNQIVNFGTCLFGSEEEQYKFEMQVISMYQHLNEERAEILKDYMQ